MPGPLNSTTHERIGQVPSEQSAEGVSLLHPCWQRKNTRSPSCSGCCILSTQAHCRQLS